MLTTRAGQLLKTGCAWLRCMTALSWTIFPCPSRGCPRTQASDSPASGLCHSRWHMCLTTLSRALWAWRAPSWKASWPRLLQLLWQGRPPVLVSSWQVKGWGESLLECACISQSKWLGWRHPGSWPGPDCCSYSCRVGTALRVSSWHPPCSLQPGVLCQDAGCGVHQGLGRAIDCLASCMQCRGLLSLIHHPAGCTGLLREGL